MKNGVREWLVRNQWLIIITALVVGLRLPSLFEPYWYGDEAIYLTIGQAIDRGVPLYSGIHDNKPPLLYLVAAAAGGNEFWFKFIAMAWNLVTIWAFANLGEKIFERRKKPVVVATLAFALATTLPVWEGNIANAELFFLLPTILAVNWLWRKNASWLRVAVAGIAIGVAGLFKVPAILEAGIWPLIWSATGEKKIIRKILILGAGVALPVGLTGIYFAIQGELRDYVTAAWLQNLPYISSWQAGSAGGGLFSVKGRAVVAIILLAGMWGMARRWGRTVTIIGMWGIVTLFAALLSGRPYPHYLLQTAGAAAIAAALLWEKARAEKIAGAAVLIMIFAVWKSFGFYEYPVWRYYQNFGQWIWGGKSTQGYLGWFSPQVNADYEIAGIIKAGTMREDKIFVWGDEPAIYALAQRLPVGVYTVKYQIQQLQQETTVMKDLVAEKPKYVVSFGSEEQLPGLGSWLQNNYLLERTVGAAKVYNRL